MLGLSDITATPLDPNISYDEAPVGEPAFLTQDIIVSRAVVWKATRQHFEEAMEMLRYSRMAKKYNFYRGQIQDGKSQLYRLIQDQRAMDDILIKTDSSYFLEYSLRRCYGQSKTAQAYQMRTAIACLILETLNRIHNDALEVFCKLCEHFNLGFYQSLQRLNKYVAQPLLINGTKHTLAGVTPILKAKFREVNNTNTIALFTPSKGRLTEVDNDDGETRSVSPQPTSSPKLTGIQSPDRSESEVEETVAVGKSFGSGSDVAVEGAQTKENSDKVGFSYKQSDMVSESSSISEDVTSRYN